MNYFQQERWERGRSPVGGDCYHTIFNSIFKIKYWFVFIPNICAMEIAPYGCFKIQKYDNMSYFSQKLCFNVKMALSERWSER